MISLFLVGWKLRRTREAFLSSSNLRLCFLCCLCLLKAVHRSPSLHYFISVMNTSFENITSFLIYSCRTISSLVLCLCRSNNVLYLHGLHLHLENWQIYIILFFCELGQVATKTIMLAGLHFIFLTPARKSRIDAQNNERDRRSHFVSGV